jgi:hypothetical protein
MLRKLIQAGAIIVLLSGAASAQVSPLPDNHATLTKEEKAQKDADEAYKEGVKKIPAPEKKSVDPWGDVRPSPPTAAKNK